MTLTPTRPGRWLISFALIAAGWCSNVATAQDDFPLSETPTIRGQSPYGLASLPPGSQYSFGSSVSPWITTSHATINPPRIAQAPTDPFTVPPFGGSPPFGEVPQYGETPTYGSPILGDPGLSVPFLAMPAVWQPYIAAQGKAGNYNAGAFGQLVMPLYQDGQTLLFADIRGRFDDSNNSEGNFGLGLRKMIDPNWFVGINGFFDRKHTENGNNFNQGTVGIEAMSVKWEARMNGYLPESGAKTANDASTTEFDSGTIFVRGGLERAYYGVDGELGVLLWEQWAGGLELRGFAGGYWFDTSDKSFPSVAGPKGRLELRFYDLSWFGPQSRLTLGVEVQHDDVRDTQVSGLARLEIPLGVFPGTRRLTRLERRMLDRIVRDDDIITVTGQGPREVGIDSLTKRSLTNVTLVDATTVGTTPLATAVTNAGVNSIVVVDGSRGAITTPGNVTPLSGQVLRGGGFQVIGTQTGATANFGARPTITSTNNANNTILLNNNFTTVADLDLVGGLSGVFAANARTNVLISGNTVTGAASDGYSFNGLDATSTIQNNTAVSSGRDATGVITNTAADGFEFNGTTAATIRGNTATNSGDSGFDFVTLSGTLDLNTATGNGGPGSVDGFGIDIANLAATGTVSNNVTNNNFFGGVRINSAIPAGGVVTGNTANNNGRDATGAIVNAAADGFLFNGAVSGTVSNNTASSNADRGFEFNGALAAGGRVTGNSAIQNFGRGFHFATTLDAGSEVSGNYASRNGFNLDGTANPAGIDGFAFIGAVSGKISENISENNQQAGFFIESLQAAGSVLNNTATSNPFGGFVFNTTVAGVVDKNTATGSNSTAAGEGYGFDFTTANLAATARVTENVSSFNRNGFGFNTSNVGALINGNNAAFSGLNSNGTVFDATGNGYQWLAANNATVTNNLALGNANNGFSGANDNPINHNPAVSFSQNVSNNNGDRGYVITLPNAGVTNNTGSGNVNGGNTAP